MQVFIVIAAYNAEKALPGVIKDLKSNGYKNMVVVDDGSDDETAEVAEDYGAIVLQHAFNLGQGAALRTGIEFALQQGAEVIVTMDSDGQHAAEDVKALVNPVADSSVDVALGSRFIGDGSNVPFIRRLFLKAGALLFRFMYGIKLTDSHNGFRVLSRSAAKRIEITSNRMEHASEIIEQIARKKISFMEVPVKIKYTQYSLKHGQTNLAAFRIFFETIARKLLR